MGNSSLEDLLTCHGDPKISFRIRDQLARKVQRDTLDGPVESELAVILLLGCRLASVIATGQALRTEDG